MTAADALSQAAKRIRDGRVQLFLDGGVQWLPDADYALAVLLSMMSNSVWHEDTNHVPVLPSVIREVAEQLAGAILQERV